MTTRGRRPKPAALRLIDGTHRPARHGPRVRAQEQARAARAGFGPLEKPDDLGLEASAIWDRLIEPAGWLDGSRYAAAVAFCMLWGEFRSNSLDFGAAKHAQMRGYSADLGLTDERNRPEPPRPAEPADPHFL